MRYGTEMARRPGGASLPMQEAGRDTRPVLLVCGGAPRRNRTGDPILTMDHQEPLCGPPFPQVTSDRSGQSYRFSFDQVMRSVWSRLAVMVAMSRSSSGRIRRWTSGAANRSSPWC
jgi:hypothetical protein